MIALLSDIVSLFSEVSTVYSTVKKIQYWLVVLDLENTVYLSNQNELTFSPTYLAINCFHRFRQSNIFSFLWKDNLPRDSWCSISYDKNIFAYNAVTVYYFWNIPYNFVRLCTSNTLLQSFPGIHISSISKYFRSKAHYCLHQKEINYKRSLIRF